MNKKLVTRIMREKCLTLKKLTKNFFHLSILHSRKVEGKEQELLQSNTTPDPGLLSPAYLYLIFLMALLICSVCKKGGHQGSFLWETPKVVLLQTVKTQMKCSMMLHFNMIYTVCKGKKYVQTKLCNIFGINIT